VSRGFGTVRRSRLILARPQHRRSWQLLNVPPDVAQVQAVPVPDQVRVMRQHPGAGILTYKGPGPRRPSQSPACRRRECLAPVALAARLELTATDTPDRRTKATLG
jgi:hypothetical protein